MKQILRAFLFLLLFTATGNTAMADEKANVTKQGTVRGRIIDATKQTLPGASIYIEKLHTGVTSDVNGFYTFSNLDPGTYTVKVSYVGYSPVELKITIPAGRTLEKDVVLNEGVELQEVVVGGAFQGQRRAINSQKNNMGITNVVSADQVGKFPDSNIGDALKRISGINVQYDQGEARFGQVRGTSADLSSVTINGNRVPSAEGDTRNVQLDLIPADMIQTIEVEQGGHCGHGRRRHRRQHQPRHQELPLQAHHCRHCRNRLQLGERKGATEPWLHLRRPLLQRQTRLDCIGLLSELTFRLLRHRIRVGAGR